MEMIMSTILSAPVGAQGIAGQSWAGGLAATLKSWWLAYIIWRIERAAIAHLHAMTDRELRDIGISRSEIEIAASGERATDPTIRANL